jgi:hypothetical protein
MGRQARVKPQYAEWFPHIPSDRWQSAAVARRVVLRQLRYGSPIWEPEERVLSDTHFDFQGGMPAGASRAPGIERRRPLRRDLPSS